MELVFATNNPHKLHEIRGLLNNRFRILSLQDIGCYEEIPEEGATLEENASQKARFLTDHYGCDCFADDTGLEVEALGGEPGVFSARYAGPGKSAADNVEKLLKILAEINHRRARFRTVISLIINGKKQQFEGVVEGEILYEKRGTGGFGYDPIFRPFGSDRTFAEMDLEAKNLISHRGRAFEKMAETLCSQPDGVPEKKGIV